VRVSLRVAALIGGAVVVFGLLVYLYVAVHAAPTAAMAASESSSPPAPSRPRDEVARSPEPAPSAEIPPGAVAAMQAPTMPSEPAPIATDLATDPTLELSTAMDEANRLYDRSEHDAAQEAALKILQRAPGNVRMLRIVVTTACLMGEPEKAQQYWLQLPDRDREQMSTRCARVGVTFKP
jgi:hypothetical protein